jgi:protein-S-isoprenylcysteine O-methyltransferase Ste14
VLPFSALVVVPVLILLLARSTALGINMFLLAAQIPVGVVMFFVTNTLDFHFSEEKGLERFGAEYVEYKMHVPMWLPRPKRWDKAQKQLG